MTRVIIRKEATAYDRRICVSHSHHEKWIPVFKPML
ncbi:hypothetical protein AGROH133_05593 [Agrobacterium tumefaciens]|nr:hypothetical protein AGROH133_05593 [Agrobacterium tumefaciens]